MSQNVQLRSSSQPPVSTTSGPSSLPTTPQDSSKQSRAATPASTPGTWKHPRMDEIAARQSASTFTDKNVNIVTWNALALLSSFVLNRVIRRIMPFFFEGFTKSLSPYGGYVLWFCRLVLLYNIVLAASPLMRPKDNLSDIPLTPTQRKLLGLAPNSTPETPGSQYITPPRFPRSTPRSSERATVGSSMSGRSSPRGGSPSGSPYSPVPSPLLQKAVNGSATRRLSYGTPSPLSSSRVASDSSLDQARLPSTPTPSSGSRASVPLNNRWLYERGRSSPSRNSLYT
ncbi:hypothetical protein EV356DRAFT_534302 [Viridothelium virens]|uniref:Nuclear pore complex component n=1 Tax=Viridothelium virens TaxID=1048519 RepID=A0A6A6H4G0_VIRVR|nr:hypothetical protein EV356DRAFT_534302 [Viridothelium virens]